MKICWNCKSMMDDNEKKCPECGEIQYDDTYTPPPEKDVIWKKRINSPLIKVILAVAIGYLVVGYIKYASTKKNSNTGKQQETVPTLASTAIQTTTHLDDTSITYTTTTSKIEENISTTTEKKEEPTLKEILTTYEKGSDENYNVYYTCCIYNPSKTDILNVSYKITALGENNKILGKSYFGFKYIPPDTDFWDSNYSFSTYEEPVEIKVEFDSASFKNYSSSKFYNTTPLTIIDKKIIEDTIGIPRLVFDLRNDNDLEMSTVKMSIIYRDEKGRVLQGSSGDSNYIQGIEPNSTQQFSERIYPKSDNFEVFFYPLF